MLILAIETSCDDTCAAIVKSNQKGHRILSNIVSSQVKVHAPFGGIVPNLAAREHLKNIKPCLNKTLKDAQQKPKDIDLIAATIGPGLIPSLLVGVNFAKALAYAWQKPIIGINHLEGHIYANWLPCGRLNLPHNHVGGSTSHIRFPALCLIVSGGHTQLILMKDHGKYKLLGETRDDAAGEAFDKVAKLLGLGYPGGPIISKMAQKGNPMTVNLPRPMINSGNYNFSFSGLKTAVLYKVRPFDREGSSFRICPLQSKDVSERTNLLGRGQKDGPFVFDICASFQQAVIDVLIAKTIKAAKEHKIKTIMLSGGVAANQELRKQLGAKIKKEIPNTKYKIPDTKFCTDNAVMIALAAYYQAKNRKIQTWSKIQARANLKLS